MLGTPALCSIAHESVVAWVADMDSPVAAKRDVNHELLCAERLGDVAGRA